MKKGGDLHEAKGGDLTGGGLATWNGSDSYCCSDVAICIGGPGAFLDNGDKDADWVTIFVATQGDWELG